MYFLFGLNSFSAVITFSNKVPTEAMLEELSIKQWREEGKAKMKAAMWDSILATVKAKKPDDRKNNASPIFISFSLHHW